MALGLDPPTFLTRWNTGAGAGGRDSPDVHIFISREGAIPGKTTTLSIFLLCGFCFYFVFFCAAPSPEHGGLVRNCLSGVLSFLRKKRNEQRSFPVQLWLFGEQSSKCKGEESMGQSWLRHRGAAGP